MAEGGSENNKKYSPPYRNYLGGNEDDESANSEIEESNIISKPDLFNDNVLNVERKLNGENLTNPNQNEAPRREENPFSFKHFLNRDIQQQSSSSSSAHTTPYQQTGARPKIFSSTRQHSLPASANFQNVINESEPHRMSSVDNVRAEFPSARLPDFVQDHLVVKQCYLGNDGSCSKADIDNMPDFTLNNRVNDNQWQNNHSNSNNDPYNSIRWRSRVDFPLDLPLSNNDNSVEEVTATNNSGSRSCPQSGEVGVSKSLPDFLSDGPIHSNRIASNSTTNESPITENPPQLNENERLRVELRQLRQQVHEKNIKIENLELEVNAIREKEKKYMNALAKSMEQVEGNLNSSNKRVITAENTMSKMKLEIKQLKGEISHLRKENADLRDGGGAVGGSYPAAVNQQQQPSSDVARRLAQELRGATSSAEHSLRTLLSGLNNLRVIADNVENMNRADEVAEHLRTDFYFIEDDETRGRPPL